MDVLKKTSSHQNRRSALLRSETDGPPGEYWVMPNQQLSSPGPRNRLASTLLLTLQARSESSTATESGSAEFPEGEPPTPTLTSPAQEQAERPLPSRWCLLMKKDSLEQKFPRLSASRALCTTQKVKELGKTQNSGFHRYVICSPGTQLAPVLQSNEDARMKD